MKKRKKNYRTSTAEMKIVFKAGKRISTTAIRMFFKSSQWYDWFTRRDIEYYLRKILYVATAWHGRKIVGFTALTGDGRNDAFLDSLVVDNVYRRRGIGTRLMNMLLAKIKKLQPYHFQIEVCDKKTERFYKKFGFVRNEGTWLLEHEQIADKLRAKVNRVRKRKNK
jgi:N-acetylglutamate synthase-like GNAT family acetyltransferase